MSLSIEGRWKAIPWMVQVPLALLFLFAGGMKLSMPLPALAQATGLPGWFMRFIALAEIAGALGLVLPGLLGVWRGLVPLAAAGLAAIMIGATAVSALRMGAAAAVLPAVVGVLLVVVLRGRREPRPRRSRGGSFDVSLKAARAHSLHSRG